MVVLEIFNDHIKNAIIDQTIYIIENNAEFGEFRSMKKNELVTALEYMYFNGDYSSLIEVPKATNLSSTQTTNMPTTGIPVIGGYRKRILKGGGYYKKIFILLLAVAIQFVYTLFCVFSLVGMGQYYINYCNQYNSSYNRFANFFGIAEKGKNNAIPGVIHLICKNSNIFAHNLDFVVGNMLPGTFYLYGYMLTTLLMQLKFGNKACLSRVIKHIGDILKYILNEQTSSTLYTTTFAVTLENVFKVLEHINNVSINSASIFVNTVEKLAVMISLIKISSKKDEGGSKQEQQKAAEKVIDEIVDEIVNNVKEEDNDTIIKKLDAFLIDAGVITQEAIDSIIGEIMIKSPNSDISEINESETRSMITKASLPSTSLVVKKGGGKKTKKAKANTNKNTKKKTSP